MKRSIATMWGRGTAYLVIFLSLAGVACAYDVVISDLEVDLGILLQPMSEDMGSMGCRDAVVVHPAKLSVLGLTGVGKGETVQVVHQVMNLWQIMHPQSGKGIKIRLKLTTGDQWPFPDSL